MHEQRRIGGPDSATALGANDLFSPFAGVPFANVQVGVPLDAVLDESVERSVSVTTFPVELGADINDHAIIEPVRYTMRGMVTATPTTYSTTTYYGEGSKTPRWKAAWAMLEELLERREPFDIDTGFRLYRSLIIVGLRSRKNAQLENVLDFEAQLQELRTVTTGVRERSPSDLQAGQARTGMAAEEDRGKVEKVPIDPTSSLGVKAAKAVANAITGFLPGSP